MILTKAARYDTRPAQVVPDLRMGIARRTMKTSKAYLAGIGATGVLVGWIVGMLVLGSGIVAFDGVPDLGRAPAPLERVVLKEGGRGAKDDRARLTTSGQARRADPRSAARRPGISRDRAPHGGRRGG